MLQPRGARALVKRLDAPKATSTLIEIPDSVGAKPSAYALVLAVGTLVEGGFAAGDVVIMKDYAGTPVYVQLDGPDGLDTECALVNEDDVLALVEGAGL